MDVWLRKFEDAKAHKKNEKQATSEQLVYVFSADPDSGALIVPYKARLLKSGAFGKNCSYYSNVAQLNMPPKFLTLDDVGILQKLRAMRSNSNPLCYEFPEGRKLHAFLGEVIATGRARGFQLNGPVLRWASARKCRAEWRMGQETGTQRLAFVGEDDAHLEAFPFPSPIYIDRATGECGPLETGLAPEIASLALMAPEIPPQAVPAVSSRLAASARSLPPPVEVTLRERRLVPTPVLRLFGMKVRRTWYRESNYYGETLELTVPIIRPLFDYGGQVVSTENFDDPIVHDGNDLIALRRDFDREKQELEYLSGVENLGAVKVLEDQAEYGSDIKDVRTGDYFFRPFDNESKFDSAAEKEGLAFASQIVPEIGRRGWRIETEDTWPFRFYDGPFEFRAGAEKSGVDWFSFSLDISVEGQKIDLLPLLLSMIASIPVGEDGTPDTDFDLAEDLRHMDFFLNLADGRRVAIAGSRLLPLLKAFWEAHGLSGFHLAEAGRASMLAEALEGCGVPWKGGREILKLGEKLRELADAPEVSPPDALKAVLRPYQKAGFGWLNALSETGFGGVLADDMGLGKTVQALALLVERHLARESDRPSLLVVPTSLVGNWEREAARFAPDLKLLTLHGPNRKRNFCAIAEHHLIVTTYPLIRRDYEILFAQEYDLAILDEAQAVKNPAAAISKLIRDIDARQRIALTGTPMENNLAELWALFDWLVPGLLGKRTEFNKIFRTPIEKHGDRSQQRLLSARVKPFLLRRTKEEVATELPKKTEINEIVPLEGTQRGLYETLRVAMDKRVRDAIMRKGLERTRITVLDALLKLRQVCCDPALVKLDAARKVKQSAKRTRLMVILDELVAENRKVLVFSQFVEMLKLIEADVVAQGWDYAMLTGRTINRNAQIEKFQDTQTQIFLISLKAGGFGLNLTAADTVILYDPWWNPAVERQAMDRAHRIGQDKPVFVHKMIAEGTVEAAIQTMQARKQALADALFDDSQGGPMAIGEEEIAALFAPIG